MGCMVSGTLSLVVTRGIDVYLTSFRYDGLYLRAGDDEGVLAWKDGGDKDCAAGKCCIHEGKRSLPLHLDCMR